MNNTKKQQNIGKTVAIIFSVVTAIILTVAPTIIDFKYAKGEGDILFLTILTSGTIIFCVTIHVLRKKYLEACLISAGILSLLSFVSYNLERHFHGAEFGDLSLYVAMFISVISFIASSIVGLPFYFTRRKVEKST